MMIVGMLYGDILSRVNGAIIDLSRARSRGSAEGDSLLAEAANTLTDLVADIYKIAEPPEEAG
jgi:hypothetical protein